MEPVDNADDIWKIPKYGARVPFVLKIRLSGSQHLLGTITVIDLLFPFCQPSDQSASFAEFGKYRSILLSQLLLIHPVAMICSAISQQLRKCEL